jgi:hypothetical protein
MVVAVLFIEHGTEPGLQTVWRFLPAFEPAAACRSPSAAARAFSSQVESPDDWENATKQIPSAVVVSPCERQSFETAMQAAKCHQISMICR